MRALRCQAGARFLAVAVLLSLAVDIFLKDPSNLEEVFWSCYWGALVVAIGILVRSDRMVSSGTVFFAGLGMPAWVVGWFAEYRIDPTSVLMHLLPLLAGALYLTRLRVLPGYSVAGGWALHVVPLSIAWFVCDPRLKINLAHFTWPPLERFLPHPWEFQVLVLSISALTLTIAAWGINRVLLHRGKLRLVEKFNDQTAGPRESRFSLSR